MEKNHRSANIEPRQSHRKARDRAFKARLTEKALSMRAYSDIDEPNRREINVPLLEEDVTVDVDHHVGDRHYKDIPFLVLFGVNILCIVSLAFLYGVVALSSGGNEVIEVADSGKEYNETTEFTPSVQILFGMITTLAAAVTATSIWIFTLSRIASFVLNAILISLILVPITCGMVLFFMGYYAFGFTLLLLSIGLLVLSLFIRPRMDFAAVNLKVACSAVLQMPSVFGYALLAVGVQVIFCILWGIAAVGYATSNNEVTIHAHGLIFNIDECTTYVYGNTLSIPDYGTLTCTDGSCKACVCDNTYINARACVSPKLYGWAYFWLLLSLFWTSAVISNVVHCTTSAAVAKWWVVGYPSALSVQEGFERSTTTSLGSICFASLLVAVVRTTRSVLHFANKQLSSVQSSGIIRSLQRCFVRVIAFLLSVLDRLVVYFNRYALCFVAVYRYDFLRASAAASALFQQRGFSMLLNDDIIDVVLNIGHVIIGTISMCVGYVYGRVSGVGHAYTILLTVFGFAVGYLVSIVALSTISSAVATVYVSYVDNPLALQVSHPEIYVPLSEAWQQLSSTSKGGKKSAPPSGSGPATAKDNQGPAQGTTAASGAAFTDSTATGRSDDSGGTRIRGSFGSSSDGEDQENRKAQFEISGKGGWPSDRLGGGTAPDTGGAFAAGFAFIASMFPSAAGADTSAPTTRMETATGAGSAAHTLRGGYAGVPTDDSPPAGNLQSPQQQPWGPARAGTRYNPLTPSQISTPYQAQAQSQPQGAFPAQHHWGPAPPSAGRAQSGTMRPQYQGEPVFGQNFAQALTAINSLTTKLSSSVFGGPVEGGQRPLGPGGPVYRAADAHAPSAGANASLMSVQLEESFSV